MVRYEESAQFSSDDSDSESSSDEGPICEASATEINGGSVAAEGTD